MKKRLFSLVLALALCMGLVTPTLAFVEFEDSFDFGAWTWSPFSYYPLDGTKSGSNREKFEQETGLTIFSESVPDAIFGAYIYYGLKDSKGNIVFPAEFSEFTYLGNDRIVAQNTRNGLGSNHSGFGIYTLSGGVVYPPKALTIQYVDKDKQNFMIELSTGISTSSWEESAYLGSVHGIYDRNGKELLTPKYTRIDYMEKDGYYRLQQGHKDSDGTFYWSYGVYQYGVGVIIPCQRDVGISYLGSDLFRIRYSAFCYGLVDKNNNQILAPIYAGILGFQDGYYIVSLAKSQKDYQQAIKENCACDNYDSLHGTGDNSLNEAYLTMGIVDKNGNAYTSFEHDSVYFFNGKAELEKWNGGHEWFHPYANSPQLAPIKHYVKTYDTETVPLTSLTPTGKTALDILRERGVTLPGMADNVSSAPSVGGFTDVKSSDYFADAVLWAVEKNITSGTSKTTFSPNNTCSNAEILTFLWCTNGSPEPTAANPFADVKTTDYFYKAALWAAEKGLVSGSTFGANTDCTRAMTMKYMWKAAGSPAPAGKADFTDVPGNADYAQAVAWAVENNITSGTGGSNFSPAATCTRGQIVTFLHRAMGK